MKKAAIIEFGTSHSECLYSLYLFFKESGYDVTLILNDKLKNSTNVFSNKCSVQLYSFKGKRKTLSSYVAIRNLISNGGFSSVLFLTAGGVALRNFLMMPLPRKLRISGILHNTDKLTRSITGKFLFRRIRKFFVLADFMLDYLPAQYGKKTQSTYTVYYPDYPARQKSIQKNENDFIIGIPGTVEFTRRDYNGLISELKGKNIKSNVKFLLLGPGNNRDSNLQEILNRIKSNGFEDKFLHFVNYLSDADFYANLCLCDVLLPLIHPDKDNYSKFIKHKISGTYNLSIGYKIPMLCHSSLGKIDDFRSSSLFYEYGKLVELINRISSDKKFFIDKCKNLFKNEKWKFENQRKKFIDFLTRE